jgi:hypothetical protein
MAAMGLKRKILWGLGSVAAVVAVILWVTGLGHFIVFLIAIVISHVFFPTVISWDAHDAWVKCPYAIAEPRQWPATPRAACEAMYLCVNEGALSDSQMHILYGQIRNTPGCQKLD